MKIKLRNFRCHTNAKYTFPDSGLVLLSGSSGSGKSTILKAILYALYGSKAVRKPYSFGATSCSVTLEFAGMKIHRTNRPNRVVVNDDLEDEAAQAYIDEKIGVGYEEFLVSSYIAQKNNNSVLSLSQSDQLRMIKTLAFEDNQNEHKEKLKAMIRESSANLIEKRAESQLFQREVENISEFITPIEFPLTSEEDTEEEAIKKYRKRMRMFNKHIETLLDKKASLNEELQHNIHTETELDRTVEQLDQVNTNLSHMQKRHQQLELLLKDVPKDLETQVDYTEKAIQYLELQEELSKLQSQFDQIRQDEAVERENRRVQLESTLWKYNGEEKTYKSAKSEIEDCQEQLRLWKQYQRATRELYSLQKQFGLDKMSSEEMIDHYNRLIDNIAEERAILYRQKEQLAVAAEKLALEKEIVHCPECKVPLRWKNSELVSVHDLESVEERDYKMDIDKVVKQLQTLQKTSTKYERCLQQIRAVVIPVIEHTDPDVYKQLETQVSLLITFITQNKQSEEDLARIKQESKNNYLTPALKRLQKQIDKQQSMVDEILKELDPVPTEKLDSLRKKLQELHSQYEHYQNNVEEMVIVSKELSALKTKNTQLQSQLDKFKQQLDNVDNELIKKKIKNISRDITTAKQKQVEDEALSEKLDQYLAYREQQKELERREEQLNESNKQLKIAERVHAANLTLKDKYTQAEIIALESTIDSINEHTRYYLDSFFAEHQLSVQLEAAQKGKQLSTLKINTAINYKGNVYDDISQLSGGEFDRCTLASICGINSMLGSPILILDESLSSLDAETNTEIIRFLSDLAEDKLILVCSHEAVRGIFDNVLEL